MPITPDGSSVPQSYSVEFRLGGEIFSATLQLPSTSSEEDQDDAVQSLVDLLSAEVEISNIVARKISAQAYTITEEV